MDFEGDQFTFFKFPHDELERLYGIVVQEHSIYEPLAQHIETQVARGHLMIVEVDAWFLPDTRGSAYRTQHTKTTIGIDAIDRARRQLGYFHNSGYYVAEEIDYDGLVGGSSPMPLPPYVECAKRRFAPLDERVLCDVSLAALQRHLRRLPLVNPVAAFRRQLQADAKSLAASPLERFHGYSFNSVRQLGANFELFGHYARWLQASGCIGPFADIRAACERIAAESMVLEFRLARLLARQGGARRCDARRDRSGLYRPDRMRAADQPAAAAPGARSLRSGRRAGDAVTRASAMPAWSMLATPAGAAPAPSDLPAGAGWIAAPVPGTVAQALAVAGRLDEAASLDERDHWYRVELRGHGARLLRFHGLATLAQAWLDDTPILHSDSMFVTHDVRVTLAGQHTLFVCFRALAPHLRTARAARRARWRTRLAEPATLRTVRTSLLGHMPGWFPHHVPTGPWRPVDVLDPAEGTVPAHCDLHARVDGDTGWLDAELTFAAPLPDAFAARLSCGEHHATLERAGADRLLATVAVPNVRLWWPHTHGEPVLYDIALHVGAERIVLGATGFRTIEQHAGDDGNGFGLRVNGTPVFARGACWSSAAPLALHADDATYARLLGLARDAGFNMIRVGGTMTYEADAFHAWCDRLGLMVWQDFMFANFDYALDDRAFADAVDAEADQFLARRRASPSLAVLCGGSEIAQQAAMSGLGPKQRAVELTAERLAARAAAWRPDVPYVSDSPDGGVLPFVPRERVSHYYGVGAYLRPLDDARRADVRFASECLAFANVPCDATLERIGRPHPHEPRWKAAVPRDPGASWDFDDVRDHYLRTLYDVAPERLRREDPARYFELSRAVIADVMRETFSEWRRTGRAARARSCGSSRT
jgi:beta-mannosidase